MAYMSMKVGLLYVTHGTYEAISNALEGAISADKIRKIHIGESTEWFKELDDLAADIETDYVPMPLLKMRSALSYLTEAKDNTALILNAEAMSAALDKVVDWDEGQDDQLDYRRSKPFAHYLRGHLQFAQGYPELALISFRKAATGFWALAPGESAISTWEIMHLSLAQQMTLSCAYELFDKGLYSEKVLSQTADELIKEGASSYLDDLLKIAPVWPLAFNYASMLSYSSACEAEKVRALERAIHINPQLANFDLRLPGMTETVNECPYLSKISDVIEIRNLKLLTAARGIVAKLSEKAPEKPLTSRALPTARRQLAIAITNH